MPIPPHAPFHLPFLPAAAQQADAALAEAVSPFLTLGSFVLFTGLVALGTWLLTRKDKHDTSAGYFLGGRSLTAGFIAGSLLLTNLSTEQLVGLNGAAFADGLSVMAWEVVAGVSLVVMALMFLPRYLKSGIATVPQFLAERYGHGTQTITTLIFISAYAVILLPIVLYTGATGLMGILDLKELTGIESRLTLLTILVWLIGVIGSIYAIFGGLRSVAVSDTLNGFGLLAGGLLIAYLGLKAVNPDGVFAAIKTLKAAEPAKFNSLGGPTQSVPWHTLFTGVLLLNLFYWCTNQQIIQRAFGAPTLAEGQKGVLLAGFFKVLAPIILVLPGIIAFHLYGRVELAGEKVPVKDVTTAPFTIYGTQGDAEVVLHGADAVALAGTESLEDARTAAGKTVYNYKGKPLTVTAVAPPDQIVTVGPDEKNVFTPRASLPAGAVAENVVSNRLKDTAYGTLVRRVLPAPLAGFFAAVMVGAILSSFNSALNSTATLFSLGVYKAMLKPVATERQVIASGKWFGLVIAVTSMLVAPLLLGQDSIFGYLQKMNGIYFIPIFAVVVVGMTTRRVPGVAANVALLLGVAAIAVAYFVPPVTERLKAINDFHLLGIVFVSLIALMLVVGRIAPRATAWEQRDSKEVDLTPWRFAVPAGLGLVAVVAGIYLSLADTSVLRTPEPSAPPAAPSPADAMPETDPPVGLPTPDDGAK